MKLSTVPLLRKLLWAYFLLLIFEGALRKWFLPGLSTPLLLIRDPIAVYSLFIGWPLLRKRSWYTWITPLVWIGVSSFFVAVLLGHGSVSVALFGSRIFLLHLPLIFLFPIVFNRNDVLKFCITLLFLSIPMTFLLILQSNSPDTHFLNIGPGGQASAAFDGALGRSRPPGTFSFITGVVSFYSLALASQIILLYERKPTPREILLYILSGSSIIFALPVSISRSLLAAYLIILFFSILSLLLSRTSITSLLASAIAIFISFYIALSIPFFHVASEAFLARWDSAGLASGSNREKVGDFSVGVDQIKGRILPGVTTPLSHLDNIPFFGYGVGLGSNFGAQKLGYKTGFVLGEGTWEITIGELGFIMGLSFLLWRLLISISIFNLSCKSSLMKNKAPLIIFGSVVFPLLLGGVSQPSELGFLVFASGLSLAAMESPTKSI